MHNAYFERSNPLLFFGLPTSDIEDMGNHYAMRFQRAVLQEWKEDVPWAAAGQVTVANGGDIAKELGHLPETSLLAEDEPSSSERGEGEGGEGEESGYALALNETWSEMCDCSNEYTCGLI